MALCAASSSLLANPWKCRLLSGRNGCVSRHRFPGLVVHAHAEPLLVQGLIDTAPTTVASQNAVQNALVNAPDFVKESPERVLIAVSLVAAAVIGYLLSQKVRQQ
eukprot:jgi/Botrbrau1/22379/Bobra.0002s0056.1